MSKKLTREYVVMRTKCDRLEKLKNLNLWGCDLEDVSVINQMSNLEVVSLSVNRIKTLKDFGTLRLLRELYLRKNFISDIGEIRFLEKCPNLKVLWLSENPLADTKNYRLIVIRSLPNLTKLDDTVISAEERNNALNGADVEDNYNNIEEENRSVDCIDHKEENVIESKGYLNNKNSGNVANIAKDPVNIINPPSKFDNHENIGYKKSNTSYEDGYDNELKTNFNYMNKNSNKNINNNNSQLQPGYDAYNINPDRLRVSREKTPVNNKYDYDNYQYEESNMVDRFENMNVGGGRRDKDRDFRDRDRDRDPYSKRNEIRRESRKNYNDNYSHDHMNDYRQEDYNANKKNKMDEYNDNLREYNNNNTSTNTNRNRRSQEIILRNQGSNKSRSANVLSCVLLLLKELNENDLDIVRDEIDQKLGYY